MSLAFQFNYVPYPLWRRHWPGWLRPALNPLWDWVYPVAEDRQPPPDTAALVDYIIRYRLMPDMDMREIQHTLESCMPQVETPSQVPPETQVDLPLRIPAQWEPMESVMVNWPVWYPPLWDLHSEMVEAVLPVAEVVITVPSPLWAGAVMLYLARRGLVGEHHARLRMLHIPTNDIWVRDHGPIVGYDRRGQRVAVDAIYDHLPQYPQHLDDLVPLRWAAYAGVPHLRIDLHTEGGNLWTDGKGTIILTEQIFNENPLYTIDSLRRYLHEIFDFEKLIVTPRMNLEHTGHVDLLVKLADAQTVLVSTPPRPGAERFENTLDLFRHETNACGAPYRVVELPTPPLYFNWITYPIRRSYTNALTVNGRVLVPVYDLPMDALALRIYEETMPNHEIVPIHCRVGANGGGAVHCLTKEIPAP
jgi:agmatine deiminase